MQFERSDIMNFLVNNLFLVRLELADAGFEAKDFTEDTLILDKVGLGLDSVDVLDLLIGIEKKYNLKPIEIDHSFIEDNCRSISGVIDMIQARTGQAV